jgi:hypothetical protein
LLKEISPTAFIKCRPIMLMLFITAWFENESSEPIVPDIQIARIYRPGGIVAAP